MYAVIKTGGKQYRVAPGEKLKVEQIPADIGSEVVLDQVLLVGNGDAVTVGKPLVAGASVTTNVLAQGRGVDVAGRGRKPPPPSPAARAPAAGIWATTRAWDRATDEVSAAERRLREARSLDLRPS